MATMANGRVGPGLYQRGRIRRKQGKCLLQNGQNRRNSSDQYLHKKGLAPDDAYTDIVATLGNDSASYASMKLWNLSVAGRALGMAPVLEGL